MFFDYEAGIDQLYKDNLVFSEATMLVAHNAFASVEDGWIAHPMQQFDYMHQFYYGARGFMIDVYEVDGELVLLHNKNWLNVAGVGSSVTKTFYLEDFLRGIKNLLDKHPHSIISLMVENHGITQKEIKSSIIKTKLENYLLLDNPNDHDLTFGEMRNSNQRLVIFTENGPQLEKGLYSTAYYKETTYSLEGDEECKDRHENRAPFANKNVKIFLMNHFYTKSCASAIDQSWGIDTITAKAKVNCNDANNYDFIAKRANICKQIMKKNPTFIAVDFIEQGNNGGALKAVSDLVDKSFYEKHLQYSKYQPSSIHPKYNLKSVTYFVSGALLGGVIGGMLTYFCCPRVQQHLPQHME